MTTKSIPVDDRTVLSTIFICGCGAERLPEVRTIIDRLVNQDPRLGVPEDIIVRDRILGPLEVIVEFDVTGYDLVGGKIDPALIEEFQALIAASIADTRLSASEIESVFPEDALNLIAA